MYHALKQDQSSGSAQENGKTLDTLSLFHVHTVRDFGKLAKNVQKAMRQGSGYVGSVRRDHAKVLWQGLLAALCELRQCAQRYTWSGLEVVLTKLDKNVDVQMTLQREQQTVLMQTPYVGMSHGCYMFKRAIQLLQVQVPRNKTQGVSPLNTVRARKMICDACRLGLCPKILLPNISEVVEIQNAFRTLSVKAAKVRAENSTAAQLRKQAFRLGYRSLKRDSKATLLRKIQRGKQHTPIRWSDWAAMCRNVGIDPVPTDQKGLRKKLPITEMRGELLQTKNLPELRAIAARGSIPTSGKRKHDLIEEVLQVKHLH